jgi:hypothetical protein
MGDEASPTTPPAPLYLDGCPGCAMERKKASSKGIPYKELFFVAVTTIASGTCQLIVTRSLSLCHISTSLLPQKTLSLPEFEPTL